MWKTLALLVFAIPLVGADWLSEGGNAHRAAWQRDEHGLTAANVGSLKLLWKRKLEDQLTAPVILGPIITHRGIKELVIVGGGSGHAYAIDADLGKVVWETPLESAASCAGLTATPAIEPAPGGKPVVTDEEEPSNLSRRIFFVTGDGRLHTLRATDGAERGNPSEFLPPGVKTGPIEVAGDSLYATTVNGCGGASNNVWALNLRRAGEKPSWLKWSGSAISGLATGDAGVYVAAGGIFALPRGSMRVREQLAAGASPVAPVVFEWKGRECVAVVADKQLTILDGKDFSKPLFRSEPLAGGVAGLAAWADDRGTQWVMAGLTAFRLADGGLTKAWERPESAAPVVANGVVFAAAGGKLWALDGASGRVLFSGGDVGDAGALAVANGHVCFTSGDTLYCFGLPMEI